MSTNFSIRSLLLDKADSTTEISSPPYSSPPTSTISQSSISSSSDDGSRPPYTYRALIVMAIRESPEQRLTLTEIYQWISKRYRYYRQNISVMQNSIRHNLSIDPLFIKVRRALNDPGRGNYWALHPSAYDVQIAENTDILHHNRRKVMRGWFSNTSTNSGPHLRYESINYQHPYYHPQITNRTYWRHQYSQNTIYYPSTEEIRFAQQMAKIHENQKANLYYHMQQQLHLQLAHYQRQQKS